jgi:hypothetical protein
MSTSNNTNTNVLHTRTKNARSAKIPFKSGFYFNNKLPTHKILFYSNKQQKSLLLVVPFDFRSTPPARYATGR